MVALESISQLPKHPWNLTDDVILSLDLESMTPLPSLNFPPLVDGREPRERKGWSRRARSDPPEASLVVRGSRKSLNLDCTSEMTLVPLENFVSLAERCLKASTKKELSLGEECNGDRERRWAFSRGKI